MTAARHLRVLPLIVLASCATTSVKEEGVTATQLACPMSIYIEPQSSPLRQLTRTELRVLRRRFRFFLPHVTLAPSAAAAEAIVTISTFPDFICVDCDMPEDTNWTATVSPGGLRRDLPSSASLSLQGHTRIGNDPFGEFVRQLKRLLYTRCSPKFSIEAVSRHAVDARQQ